MASVNKVILMGNCGRDPEVKYLANGKAVTNLSIATSTRRKDKSSGETVEDTQWHRVTLYERMAEIAGEYVRKGSQVYIEGRIKYGKYTAQDGSEKNTVDIVATEMQLMGGKPQGDRAAAPRPPAPAPQREQSKPSGGGSGFDDMDDDIPFVSSAFVHDVTTGKSRRMARTEF